ncbi:MAG: ABC transporter substrate-binding protein [Spirochaetaceae bacterium]|jgi:iron complex transport system substrate-binding protein|nr:ABC transporter substrate-binding protein [Spirochaetaceae bacterium]
MEQPEAAGCFKQLLATRPTADKDRFVAVSGRLWNRRRRVLLILFSVFLTACAKETSREVLDRTGRKVLVGKDVKRVISMAPSNTEIIVDLGMAHKLVAVDRHSADIPDIPENLPLLDFFYPDAEVIVSLKPDLIIANGHNATGTGEDPFRVLEEMGIPAAYLSMSRSVGAIYDDILFIADMLGAREPGEKLVQEMRDEIAAITEAGTRAAAGKPRTVYFEISAAPEMMTFGKDSYLNDMVGIIGARNIFEHENWILSPGAEAVIQRNPEVILTNVNYLADPVAEIRSRPGFEHITAVKEKRIYVIDTNSSVRPSARIVRALKEMIGVVYPETHATDPSR